jgi:hypothetical protein
MVPSRRATSATGGPTRWVTAAHRDPAETLPTHFRSNKGLLPGRCSHRRGRPDRPGAERAPRKRGPSRNAVRSDRCSTSFCGAMRRSAARCVVLRRDASFCGAMRRSAARCERRIGLLVIHGDDPVPDDDPTSAEGTAPSPPVLRPEAEVGGTRETTYVGRASSSPALDGNLVREKRRGTATCSAGPPTGVGRAERSRGLRHDRLDRPPTPAGNGRARFSGSPVPWARAHHRIGGRAR